MNDNVRMIPIEQIRIINPRYRDRKKFEVIINSIRTVGLKKPILVSMRSNQEGTEPGYDLVCGQGRMEAFVALGHKEIPALVGDIPKQARLLRSLIENMARRFPDPSDLINEIERLKKQGYTNVAIGEKLGMCGSHVGGLLALKQSGEERLLEWALCGKIPWGIAMEIAKIKGVDEQREFLKAYANKQLKGASIRMVKRLLDQRRFLGKSRRPGESGKKTATSAEGLVNAYKKEMHKQKLFVRKARVTRERLLFLVTAFSKLMTDEGFVTLLRAESLSTLPHYLAEKIVPQKEDAA